jgi:two-component sensor histidine kinase/PAS domain-containing protein
MEENRKARKTPRGGRLSKNAKELRRRAEELLISKQGAAANDGRLDVKSLLHELSVHEVELEMQNEELQRINLEAEQAHGKYLDLYDFAPVGYVTLDWHGEIIEMNLAAAALMKMARKQIIGRRLQLFITPMDIPTFNRFLGQVFATDGKQSCEVALATNGAALVDVHIEGIRQEQRPGAKLECRAVLIDITESKRAEDQIKSALLEKETLLRELYHRTKNNMQVISSMLTLQAAAVDNVHVKKIFQEMENRIHTMALVHQKLYQTHNLSRINLEDYIIEVVSLLLRSYSIPADKVTVTYDLKPVVVLIDTAIPCGLIINELVSNALLHAFPQNGSGEIRIRLAKTSEDVIELDVSDNGKEMPDGFDFRSQDTLGIQTILGITEHQLQGNAQFKVDHGVSCQIRFKDIFHAPRV